MRRNGVTKDWSETHHVLVVSLRALTFVHFFRPLANSTHLLVQNSKLNKTIMFGGYSPCLMTDMGRDGCFDFSYYADTFVFNHTTSSWKQVLTRGFPTYRAQSHLISDPSTGKTFLVGGYTNSDYVPSKKKFISRSFDDLWQLCIDEPGGFFEASDFEMDARTAQAGPWQRCFACSSIGQWRKCGGTFNNFAFQVQVY